MHILVNMNWFAEQDMATFQRFVTFSSICGMLKSHRIRSLDIAHGHGRPSSIYLMTQNLQIKVIKANIKDI